MDPDKKSPIVRCIFKRLSRLYSCTPYGILKQRLGWEKSPKIDIYIERWAIGCFILSIVLFFLSFEQKIKWWEIIFLVVGAVRIIELIIVVARVLFFHGFKLEKSDHIGPFSGPRRLVILLLLNYIELVFWFALFNRNFLCLSSSCLNEPTQALAFSFVNISGVGTSSYVPVHPAGRLLVLFQSVIGVFMALTVLAKFISYLPGPKNKEDLD